LLPISDFTITLRPSNDYLRCVVFLHVMTAIVILRSALPVVVMGVFLLLLILLLVVLAQNRRPLSRYCKLTYHPGYWLLHEVNGRSLRYEEATLLFNGGIFTLFTLSGKGTQKILTLFNDQMCQEQQRVLTFMVQHKLKKRGEKQAQ